MGCLLIIGSVLIGIGLFMLHPALGVIYVGLWVCGVAGEWK